jgi:hypothetical protein
LPRWAVTQEHCAAIVPAQNIAEFAIDGSSVYFRRISRTPEVKPTEPPIRLCMTDVRLPKRTSDVATTSSGILDIEHDDYLKEALAIALDYAVAAE